MGLSPARFKLSWAGDKPPRYVDQQPEIGS